MHSSNSILLSVLELIRGYLDLPDDKYDDDYILRQVMKPNLEVVWNGISNTTQAPILSSYDIEVTTTQSHYLLPCNVSEVWQLMEMDSYNNVVRDWKPRNHFNPKGPGWRIEGNHLTIEPLPSQNRTWTLVYAPGSDWYLHKSATGIITGTQAMTVGTATLGHVDPRDQGLAGAFLRILKRSDDSTTTVEEHVIATYDASSGAITTRTAFSDYTVKEIPVHYEIVPPQPGAQAFVSAWAARSALSLGAMANITARQRNTIMEEYRGFIKVIRDRLGHYNLRNPKHIDKDTVDNSDRMQWGGLWM